MLRASWSLLWLRARRGSLARRRWVHTPSERERTSGAQVQLQVSPPTAAVGPARARARARCEETAIVSVFAGPNNVFPARPTPIFWIAHKSLMIRQSRVMYFLSVASLTWESYANLRVSEEELIISRDLLYCFRVSFLRFPSSRYSEILSRKYRENLRNQYNDCAQFLRIILKVREKDLNAKCAIFSLVLKYWLNFIFILFLVSFRQSLAPNYANAIHFFYKKF